MANISINPSSANAKKAMQLRESSRHSLSQWQLVVARFRKHRMGMISLWVIFIILLLTILVPFLSPFERDEINLANTFQTPLSVDPDSGRLHIFGTDRLGRDLFTRVLYGTRVTLFVAIVTTTLSLVIGGLFGAIAGYFRGKVDTVLSRFLEIVALLPDFPILLILSAIVISDPRLIPFPSFITGPIGSLLLLEDRYARVVAATIFVLVVLGWTGSARLMRGQVLSVRERDYIEATRALGGSSWRIVFRHVIPNAMPPLIVAFGLGLAGALATETALSFLGIGITEPTPTLGNILSQANSDVLKVGWLPLIPSIPVFLCALSFNYIGDGLRSALDPRANH
ncbi:MAG: ABC transporter permease [Anaerolineae bacterium]|nr:ABC transporter permease [Anaerolineae bacterium]